MKTEVICPTEGGHGRQEVTWASVMMEQPRESGHLPGNLTTFPAGQAECGEQRAHELVAVVLQNMPGWHSQTRGEFSEHGFFSTRSSKGHREGSQRTEAGLGKGSEDPPRDSPAHEGVLPWPSTGQGSRHAQPFPECS